MGTVYEYSHNPRVQTIIYTNTVYVDTLGTFTTQSDIDFSSGWTYTSPEAAGVAKSFTFNNNALYVTISGTAYFAGKEFYNSAYTRTLNINTSINKGSYYDIKYTIRHNDSETITIISRLELQNDAVFIVHGYYASATLSTSYPSVKTSVLYAGAVITAYG